MRRSHVGVLICALALGGCARGVRPAALRAEERTLADRLEAVAYRGVSRVRTGGLELARTPSGAVRIAAVHAAPSLEEADARDDLATEAAVRGKVALDPVLANVDLDIDVDRGVVRLLGEVDRPEVAARAVRVALATPGVRAVESRVAWAPRNELYRLARRAGRPLRR